jgi:hypothetical protein
MEEAETERRGIGDVFGAEIGSLEANWKQIIVRLCD